MKRCLAIGLLLVSSQSVAIECGPIMRAVTINQLQESLKEADSRITQQGSALLDETKQMLKTAKTDVALVEVQKIQSESALVSDTSSAGDRVSNMLSTAWLLAMIRDQMVDVRDKALLNGNLSIQLSGAGREAQETYQYINRILTKIRRPGVAVDVAKMRDVIEVVMKDLAKCTPPHRER